MHYVGAVRSRWVIATLMSQVSMSLCGQPALEKPAVRPGGQNSAGAISAVSNGVLSPRLRLPQIQSKVEQTNTPYDLKTIPVFDSKDNRVQLRNYPAATNVLLARLAAFLRTNPVNLATFERGKFVCTEFAQALHNSSEAAGLRCALVTLEFEKGEGHVLNAFETTDKGLIYMDCTGAVTGNAPRSIFDTVGYVQVGKKYGRLPLFLGLADPNHYERFEKVDRLWEQMENEKPRLDRDRQQLLEEDRALRKEEQQLGPPPWSPPGQAAAAELARRRQALDRRNLELKKRHEQLQAQYRQLGGRFQHSNQAPVKRVRTFW